jgi:hypothetical protein
LIAYGWLLCFVKLIPIGRKNLVYLIWHIDTFARCVSDRYSHST